MSILKVPLLLVCTSYLPMYYFYTQYTSILVHHVLLIYQIQQRWGEYAQSALTACKNVLLVYRQYTSILVYTVY